MRIYEVVNKAVIMGSRYVLLTGGEPLMQRPTPRLAQALSSAGMAVSIETHGDFSIEPVSSYCRIVMDIKTPSSLMQRGGFESNLKFLSKKDEVKFVIASKQDYIWASDLVKRTPMNAGEILFSPAHIAPQMPGRFEPVPIRWLAERILEDQLDRFGPVRLQTQLHRQIWGDARGV